MKDQAEELRRRMRIDSEKCAKTIAVVSGKGGVGKSNISINTAMILAEKGNKVLLFDLDVGMGNINILLGQTSNNTISDFLQKKLSLSDVIQKSVDGVSYISGGNGLQDIAEFNDEMVDRLLSALEKLQKEYDFIIFDMAAGASAALLEVLVSADDIFVVATPEPTSITDAYSMMKYIHLRESESRLFVICNRTEHEKQGRETFDRLQQVMFKFLQKDISLLGILPEDLHVRKAVIAQSAFYHEYPRSSIARSLDKMITGYLGDHSQGKCDNEGWQHIYRKNPSFVPYKGGLTMVSGEERTSSNVKH